MGQLSRINQEVFGEDGGTTEFGVIGSDAAGSPDTTKDLAEIQSLSQYKGGLYAITAGAALFTFTGVTTAMKMHRIARV